MSKAHGRSNVARGVNHLDDAIGILEAHLHRDDLPYDVATDLRRAVDHLREAESFLTRAIRFLRAPGD